jgi:hypothetical protein
MKRGTRLVWATSALALLLYAAGPVIAAFLEVGDRWGPKIYPRWYHQTLYSLAWKLGTHREQKPRIGFWSKEEYRPWFYGMYSKNQDLGYYGPILEQWEKDPRRPIEDMQKTKR